MASKEDKLATRSAKRQQRRETWSNLRQAFTLTRQFDKRLLPYMIGGGVLVAAVVFVVLFFLTAIYTAIVAAAVLGVITAMLIFSRRAQKTMYGQAEGQP